jgi:hypothetical protein
MKSRTWIAGAFALALGGIAQVASGTTVSVNFVGGQGGSGGGGAGTVTNVAGFNLAPNWNNALNASGSLPAAINNAGAVAASITWDSPNTWAATGATPVGGSSGTMMSGYLDNFGGRNITVSGLGADFTSTGYDVIVYFNADGPGTQGYSVADNAAHSATAFGNQPGGAGSNFPLAGANGFILSTQTASNTNFAANAVRLTGLTGDSFTLTGVNGTLGDGRARPTGFQIVSATPTALPVSSGNISINFAQAGGQPGGAGPFNVTGVAGVFPLGNWNNISGATTQANVPLIDNLGNSSAARLSFFTPNFWGQDNLTPVTQNDNLMKAYLDQGGNTAAIGVNVSGLDSKFTSGGYKVVVYGDFDSAGTFGWTVTDSNGNSETQFLRGGEDTDDFNETLGRVFVEGTALNAADAAAGRITNYAVFEGLTGSSFNITFLNGTGDGRSRINGLQIIANAVPEPGTIGLLGLSVLALLRRRRTT